MSRTRLTIAALAAVGMTASFAGAQTDDAARPATKPGKPAAAQPEQPAGMPSPEEMQKMMEAATPGPMHAHLMKAVGTWDGKVKHWMDRNAPPQESTCVSVFSSVMDGRYLKCEIQGDMAGMPFKGLGYYGYDNAAKQFQSTWIDNLGTGIMVGTGELSPDKKTMTWTMTYHCPIQNKPCTMREVERYVNENTVVLEMWTTHPEDGKDFKMMEITSTRRAARAGADAAR